jgi:hypothetical protein
MSPNISITVAARRKTPKTTPATMLAMLSLPLCEGVAVEVAEAEAEAVVVAAEEVAAATGAIVALVEDFEYSGRRNLTSTCILVFGLHLVCR